MADGCSTLIHRLIQAGVFVLALALMILGASAGILIGRLLGLGILGMAGMAAASALLVLLFLVSHTA